MFSSKTDYDLKVHKLIRRSLIESSAFDDFDYDGLDDTKEMDLDSDTVQTYTNYVAEVMSAVVFYADPTINLDQMLPKIKDAARIAVKVTKYLYKVGINPFSFGTLAMQKFET